MAQTSHAARPESGACPRIRGTFLLSSRVGCPPTRPAGYVGPVGMRPTDVNPGGTSRTPTPHARDSGPRGRCLRAHINKSTGKEKLICIGNVCNGLCVMPKDRDTAFVQH